MAEPVEQLLVERADALDSQQILRAYLDDVVSRYYGRPVTRDELTAALRDFPSNDLTVAVSVCGSCLTTSVRSRAFSSSMRRDAQDWDYAS